MAVHTIQNRLGEINWGALQPGDRVRIPPREYHEKVLFSARGAADARIVVEGLPGPNGEKPVLDGLNAVTDPQFIPDHPAFEDSGLFTVHRRGDQPNTHRPGYVTLKGFELRNAGLHNPNLNYTAFDGSTRQWSAHASGLYVICGDGVEIEDCKVHTCNNGIFVLGSQVNRAFACRRNHVWGNGWTEPNVNFSHNLYVEAIGAVYEGNHFGRPARPSCNLKDRSTGTIVRNNRIEGGTRLIDLSVAEDMHAAAILEPDYYLQIVENNLLIMKNDPNDGTQVIYCESRTDSQGRVQTVRFNRNTVACNRQQPAGCVLAYSWESPEHLAWPVLEAEGNLIWVNGDGAPWSPHFCLFRRDGHAKLGRNVFPAGWTPDSTTQGDDALPRVLIDGEENLVISGTNTGAGRSMPDPFVDSANGNYTLPADSQFAGFGCNLESPPVPSPPPPSPPPPPPSPPPPPPAWAEEARVTAMEGPMTRLDHVLMRKT